MKEKKNSENVEIEKKYLISPSDLPKDLKKYPHHNITQGFICMNPVIRVRQYADKYFLTIKYSYDKSDLTRFEKEMSIDKNTYTKLLKKCDGIILKKVRYLIPYNFKNKKYIIELDVFKNEYKGLYYAEVEFENEKEAKSFVAPKWFTKDVTGIKKYNNAMLTDKNNLKKILKIMDGLASSPLRKQ